MTDNEKALTCLKALNPNRAVSHESWVAVGMALHETGCSLQDWANWYPDNNPSHYHVCAQKWASFGRTTGPRATIASLVKFAQEDQPGFKLPADTLPGLPETIDWSTPVPAAPRQPRRPAATVAPSYVAKNLPEPEPLAPDIDLDHLPPENIPPASPEWPVSDLNEYMAALYQPDEICAYVMDAFFDKTKAKWNPCSNGVFDRKVSDIKALITANQGDTTATFGTFKPEAGAWCRLNPMDGKGTRNENVTEFRHVLAESDTLSLDKQLAIIRALNLPCSAIVHSGSKSIHAIVKVDAGQDAKLYRERVDFLFNVLARNGFNVDRQCRNPSRLSRIPGIQRGDNKQYLISGPCGAKTWAAWESAIKANIDPMPTIRSISEYVTPKPGDPAELLKSRFLCRGGSVLLVGPTGIGKSSFVMQAAFRWALGQPFMEIEPASALKILIIQAENDDGDIAEIRDGVYSGLIASGELLPDDPAQISKMVNIVCEDSRTGKDFGKMLNRLLDQHNPDLIIIDPALAYLGGDALKQADVTNFCRTIINPILHRHQCGLILVHHTNKPIRGEEKYDWKAGDLAYLGQGAADWANWARGVMAIRMLGSHTIFDFCLGKRGGRIGWKDEDGKRKFNRFIAHSVTNGEICWREPPDDEVLTELSESTSSSKGEGKKARDYTEDKETAVAIALKSVHTRNQLKEEILRTIPSMSGSAYTHQILSTIRANIDSGRLEEIRTHNGASVVHLIGPADGSVGKRRDEIEKEREAKKQREISNKK